MKNPLSRHTFPPTPTQYTGRCLDGGDCGLSTAPLSASRHVDRAPAYVLIALLNIRVRLLREGWLNGSFMYGGNFGIF